VKYWIALLTLFLAWSVQPALHAQAPRLQIQCGVTDSGKADFGTVDPDHNTDIIGQITGWCRNAPSAYVRLCVSLGRTEQGSIDPRLMADGREYLEFNIYANASRTIIWGDGSTPLARIVPIDIPTPNGDGEVTRTWYGRVPPQPLVPAGRYRTDFDRSNTKFVVHGFDVSPPQCSVTDPVEGTFRFKVSAEVEGSCGLEASPLSFGIVGNLSTAVEANTSITVHCRNRTPYNITMDAGRGYSGTVLVRQMSRTVGQLTLNYQLFSNATRTEVWGDSTLGTSTVTGVGNGSDQILRVYGTLLAQPIPGTGLFDDTVTVTLAY
jgi:spore coat protein U-like protein